MKTFRVLLAALVLSGIGAVAYSQTLLLQYQPGPRLIDGSQLNKMVDTVNSITGASGTAGPLKTSTLTANAIIGGDSSLGISGQAAASATATGSAIVVTAGAGGSTSGVGGASSVIAGSGTAGNSAGGIAKVVGGAGQGSAAGGKAQLIGGAGGATGVGGVAEVTAGSPTAGNGSNVTITASAGAGGTNAGGSVNLVPGAAVSTGAPGTVQVNGDANLICSSYRMGDTPAATDAVFFVATRPLLVTSVSAIFSVAAGGASKLQVTKDTSTNAPGAGTDLLTNNTNTGFDLALTANTVQAGTLIATVATKTLAAGDRLAVDYADAVQASVGVVVTACMAPL